VEGISGGDNDVRPEIAELFNPERAPSHQQR